MIRCRFTATGSRAVACKMTSPLCGLHVATLNLSAFPYIFDYIITLAYAFVKFVHYTSVIPFIFTKFFESICIFPFKYQLTSLAQSHLEFGSSCGYVPSAPKSVNEEICLKG